MSLVLNEIVKKYNGLPAGLGDDHFRAELVELVPEVLRLEAALDAGEQEAVVGGQRRRGARSASQRRRRRAVHGEPGGRAAVGRREGPRFTRLD